MKIFLATPKAMEQDEAQEIRANVEEFVRQVYPDASIVLASDEFKRMSGAFDGWAGWATHVATGVDYTTRKLQYGVVILPGPVMGKATASIVELRLANRHPVVMWDGKGFQRVVAVNTVDPDDYVKGWEALVASQVH